MNPSATIEWLRSGWHELNAWLAPAPCFGCGKGRHYVCEECRLELVAHPKPVTRTGVAVPIMTAMPYAGVARSAITTLKQHGNRRIARSLGAALLSVAFADPASTLADLLVMPPSRHSAYRRRGFHPIELVAHAAGLSVMNPFTVDRLALDQRSLSASQRQTNLAGAFSLRSGWESTLVGKRVALVDDVVTTGATLAELTRAATEAGAEVVSAWVLTETVRRIPLD